MAKIAPPAPRSISSTDRAAGIPETIRVLIADDKTLFRDGLSNLVAAQPDLAVVGTVDGAATANEQLKFIQPDIVLLGWSIATPRVSGSLEQSTMASSRLASFS